MPNVSVNNLSLRKKNSRTYIAKLLEGYLAIAIFVELQNRFIHNLLQLNFFKIISNHHFEYLK